MPDDIMTDGNVSVCSPPTSELETKTPCIERVLLVVHFRALRGLAVPKFRVAIDHPTIASCVCYEKERCPEGRSGSQEG